MSSLEYSTRQGNLSGICLHKVKAFRGTLHRPLRQQLILRGGLLNRLMAQEGKVTLPWGFDHGAHGPQLEY